MMTEEQAAQEPEESQMINEKKISKFMKQWIDSTLWIIGVFVAFFLVWIITVQLFFQPDIVTRWSAG